jgi:flagellar basal-body rod protein FlgB
LLDRAAALVGLLAGEATWSRGSPPMGDVSDAAIVAALRRQMTIATAKQAIAAGNLANVNTPGYRAREATFTDALDRELGSAGRLSTSNPNHVAGAVPSPVDSAEANGLPSRRDGNNVQLDRELLSMVEAAADFSAAQTVLAGKFRLIRYAINEGR